ncbi:MAG: hypothetical protein K6E86_09460 [Bacteroidales bacterium]|nr:hypothetical protein [Bacteroidales bacterium]
MNAVTILKFSPVSIGSSTFTNRANATLYVPEGSKTTYEATDYWKEFKEIIEIPDYIEIEDGEVYALAYNNDVDLHYTRTFSNTNWQALYVPFAIPIDSLTAHGLTVAELNDTHQWDLDGDGVADSTRVEFFTLTSGSTVPNYPYSSRPQQLGAV